MIQPIIMPIQHTKEITCIMQDGVRYCENNPLTKEQNGIMALGIVALMLWFMFWFWLSFKIEDRWGVFPLIPIILGGFGLPLLIIGIALTI